MQIKGDFKCKNSEKWKLKGWKMHVMQTLTKRLGCVNILLLNKVFKAKITNRE